MHLPHKRCEGAGDKAGVVTKGYTHRLEDVEALADIGGFLELERVLHDERGEESRCGHWPLDVLTMIRVILLQSTHNPGGKDGVNTKYWVGGVCQETYALSTTPCIHLERLLHPGLGLL